MSKPKIYVKYVGTELPLIPNELYSLKQLAVASNMNVTTVSTRLIGVRVCDDSYFKKTFNSKHFKKLSFSAMWLKRAII